MKFGKQIQLEQVPGWSAYYLDYKFLKKIISSLTANRPASEAAALALGIRPADILSAAANTPSHRPQAPVITPDEQDDPGQPPILTAAGRDDGRGADFQAHKAAFFFKLERELEKINAFYLRKEAELKLRLETLLSKRRAAAMRGLPDTVDDTALNHVEWSAVEEGFRLLERDLGKLQQFIEMNATGFRKILKKWDKRSRSTTKELYLARQVDVQPVFDRQLISEFSDTVALCLVNLTDLSTGLKFEGAAARDPVTQPHHHFERTQFSGAFHELEKDLRKAVSNSDKTSVEELARYSDVLGNQVEGRIHVTRILWKLIVESPPDFADLILTNVTTPFDFDFVDDINGRTCLHEAAAAGYLRLVNMCLEKGSQQNKLDVYGRSALHYAAMHGHADICQSLLQTTMPAYILDMDNCSPLVYATLRGNASCVKALLQHSTLALHSTSISDLVPLSLASQHGHVAVVLLLLEHGAQNLPNSNGEYPIHLAAREGHAEVCKILLSYEGWDTRDKYHEWTPLFHAARHGHLSCVEILLQAGSRVGIVDELGHLAVHYAAWYGHRRCVEHLTEAAAQLPSREAAYLSDGSPLSVIERAESDVDMIPSLSLPPPIMPHRVYGHNYLDRNCLVEVSVCRLPSRNFPAVKLHPRLSNSMYQDYYLPSSTPLKLVLTAGPNINSAPYSIALPQKNERDVVVFQVPSLNDLSLEFSIYPNFGTKKIGRAVALPSMFQGENGRSHILPILDNRLHTIGEVSFTVNIITPFRGVTLEVGGAVETYWKSTALPLRKSMTLKPPIPWQYSPRSLNSAHTSPSNQSNVASPSHTLTISSLIGNYVHAVIQVTRDFHPVVYNGILLPEQGFDLTVADVTLAQFEALAQRLGRNGNIPGNTSNFHEWPAFLSRTMISLAHLMKILPVYLGMALELAFPPREAGHNMNYLRLDLNESVDSVLRTIYHTSASLGGLFSRRRITFKSFSPRVCAALNWKQPNYPVLLASKCGQQGKSLSGSPVVNVGEDCSNNTWLSSVGAGVDFAKMNNLLGVFFDAELLLQVPSLIQGIRDAGLLVGVYGASEKTAHITTTAVTDGSHIDVFIKEGIVVYMDHSMRELV